MGQLKKNRNCETKVNLSFDLVIPKIYIPLSLSSKYDVTRYFQQSLYDMSWSIVHNIPSAFVRVPSFISS